MFRISVELVIRLFALVAATLPAAAIAQTQYARSAGVRIAYEVVGEGEPLVAIPGFSQSRDAWKQAGHVEAFVRSGRKVILIDPRGHGASDKPIDPAAYDFDSVADDVIAVLDAVRIERADLIGYSRGGWIAMATAIQHPQRVGTVIAGGAHPYHEDMSSFRRAVAGGLEQWVQSIESQVGPLPADARLMFMQNDVEALRAAVSRDRSDRSRALAESGVPVLLYMGSEDPRAQLARKFADETPRVEFIELKNLGHFEGFFAVDPIAALVTRTSRED